MKDAHWKAATTIFQSRNSAKRLREGVVDLHGLHAAEAEELLYVHFIVIYYIHLLLLYYSLYVCLFMSVYVCYVCLQPLNQALYPLAHSLILTHYIFHLIYLKPYPLTIHIYI